MKKIALIVVGLLVLIVAAVFAAPNLIDWNRFKPEIAQAVRDATGRDLEIKGDISVSLFSKIEFKAAGIRLANAPGMSQPDMISLASVEGSIELLPLLTRRVVVDRFVVREPRVNLAVDKGGRPNWAFRRAGEESAEPSAAREEGGGGLPISDLHLGDVRIEKGSLSFRNARTGQVVKAENLEMSVSLPDLHSAFSLVGRLVLNGKPVTIDVSVDSPGAILDGKTGAVKAALKTELAKVRLDGKAQRKPVPGLDGVFEMGMPSVGKLAAWLGRPLARSDPGPLKVRASFTSDGAKVALKQAVVEGAGLRATATGSFDATGGRTKVALRVKSGVLDIDRYLPPPSPGKGKRPERPKSRERMKMRGDMLAALSDERIDLGGLRRTEADVQIDIGGVKAAGYKVGRITFASRVKNGVLAVEFGVAELYGGKVQGTVSLDGSGDTLALKVAAAVSRVNVEKLARAASAEGPAVTGVASASVDATSSGVSPRGLAENLTGRISLDLGGVTIKTAPAGTLSGLKVALVLPGVDRSPTLKGSVVYNKQKVGLDLTLDPLRKILARERFKAKATLSSPLLTARYDGAVQQEPVPGLDGGLDLTIPSVGKLAAWLGRPLGKTQPDPGPLKLRAVFATDGAKVALKEAVVEGKALKAKADGTYDGSKSVATFAVNLDVEEADLDAYLPAKKGARAKAKKPAKAKKKGPGGWSEETIDLSALSKVNGSVRIRLASVRYRGLLVKSGRISLALENGALKLAVEELNVAKGTVVAAATVDSAKEAPAFSYRVKIAGVESGPLLKALADTDRLSGKLTFDAEGKARGRSQKEIVSSLDGDGRFKFVDGAIHGINLAAMLRKAKTLGFDQSAASARKTDFAELSGSFVIADGILKNRDFKMLAPLVRLNGEGVVPLPPRTVDYKVVAKLVASLKGQSGKDALAGLPIPIGIKGSWNAVGYNVDWQAVFEKAALDPERLKNMPADLRRAAKGFGVKLPIPKVPGAGKLGDVIKALPGLGAGKEPAPPPPPTEAPASPPEPKQAPSLPSPLKSLKKLFGK